jgi:aryl-alcohol dehydrogenase-like predicted oxidoreductase
LLAARLGQFDEAQPFTAVGGTGAARYGERMQPATRLALGGGALGRDDVSDDDAWRVLDAARAVGVSVVDVARSYGRAEERVGRWRRARRAHDFRVVTKGGYGAPGIPDWTGAALTHNVAEARARVGDVYAFLLHSCPPHVLDRDDVRAALGAIAADGCLVGYSGDNDDLHAALDLAGALGLRVVEQSLSLLDGKARVHTLPRARQAGLAVLAKRALANAPWSAATSPDAARQRARLARAALPDVGLALDELFLRFAAFTPGVDAVLVGTSRPAALERAAVCLARGPLSDDVMAALAPALARCDDDSLV